MSPLYLTAFASEFLDDCFDPGSDPKIPALRFRVFFARSNPAISLLERRRNSTPLTRVVFPD